MNKYLIAVFCMLTGCAAVIPKADAQEFAVEYQLIAEWCADHAQDLDEAFAPTVLTWVEKGYISKDCFADLVQQPLIKNLLKIVALNQTKEESYCPSCRELEGISEYSITLCKQISEGGHHIRAPGLPC